MKLKLILISIAILAGSTILIAGIGWNSMILPRFTSGMSSSSGSSFSLGSDSDEPLMEGRIGSMQIIWDAMSGRDTLNPGQMPTPEMFETQWKDVSITSEGVIDRKSGETLFDNFNTSMGQPGGKTFPMGGVERKDYEIFNSGLNDTTTVLFSGETDVLGRTAYVYRTNITDIETEIPSQLGGGFSNMEDNPLPIDGDLSFLFTDNTEYVLDPRTSIPYDLRLKLSTSFIFPDSTLLTVMDGQVRYAEESIWVPSSTVPGLMEEVNVIQETSTEGYIDPQDDMIAVYDQKITYYERSSGEPLPDDQQGPRETFAVDRSTYQYLPGYRGTQRSGQYQFPVGSIRKMDYRMWDEYLLAENTARYIGETTVQERTAYIYRMESPDVETDGGNALLPIYRHPGTSYRMDTIQEWYIDASTGFMLDFRIEGTIRVTSAGPLGLIDQSVGGFEVDLPENTTKELKNVALLFEELLIPLSNEKVEVFSMELHFTEDLQRDLIDISDDVVFYMDLFENKVPIALAVVGMVILVIPSGIMIASRIRRRK
jgi:hypothetical protein